MNLLGWIMKFRQKQDAAAVTRAAATAAQTLRNGRSLRGHRGWSG